MYNWSVIVELKKQKKLCGSNFYYCCVNVWDSGLTRNLTKF